MPRVPVQSLGQAQSLQNPAEPLPISPLCPAGPAPIPAPSARAALRQQCDSQQRLVVLKTSPFHTPLGQKSPRGWGALGHQESTKPIPSASSPFPEGWSPPQRSVPARQPQQLAGHRQLGPPYARSLSLFYSWKLGRRRRGINTPHPGKADQALSLGSAALPNAPQVVTCPNSSQAAEGRCWGHPARSWSPAEPGGGPGEAAWLADGGSGGAGAPGGASCQRRILREGRATALRQKDLPGKGCMREGL